MTDTGWIHRFLDGEAPPASRPTAESPEGRRLAAYEEALDLLTESSDPVPPGFADRVMQRLDDAPATNWTAKLRALWPGGARWVAPALAGAAAALLLSVGLGVGLGEKGGVGPPDAVAVTFEVHAPGARAVELVGSFTGWRPGEVALQGPDATGHWSATVRLPEGRHEYLFLVDGSHWVTDPGAAAHRPDGFGRRNALIEL